MPGTDERTSIWPFVGCGCAVVVAAVVFGIVGMAWYSFQKAERFEADMRDPVARDARARELLGYDEPPAGYYPMGGFSVPFVFQMAMLGDRDIPAGEEVTQQNAFAERGFVLMEIRSAGDQLGEIVDFLDGRTDEAEFFGTTDLEFSRERTVARGTVPAAGGQVRYRTEEGRMELAEGSRREVLAFLLIDCPADEILRVGLWFEPSPVEATTEAEADPPPPTDTAPAAYGGTPADSAAIGAFLDHFPLCD